MPPGNLSLQQRAGANIGVIPAFAPRVDHTHAKFVPIVLGDQILFDQQEPGVCAVGFAVFYNQSAVILTCALSLVDEVGNEFFVADVAVPAAPVGADDTAEGFILGIINPMPLPQGYKLLLRVTGPGYTGGAFCSIDCAVLVGVKGAIFDLSTSLQLVVEPPPGKGLGNILSTSPVVVVNNDTIDHKVDIYYEKDGVDTLLLKGMTAVVNTPKKFTLPSVGQEYKLKAVIQEPIATPGRVVRLFNLYIMYDSDVTI